MVALLSEGKKKTCGHVSLLITLPAGSDNDHQFLPAIITRLHQIGFLVDDLIRHKENGAQTKYVGIIKLKGMTKFEELTSQFVVEEYACAMFVFNRFLPILIRLFDSGLEEEKWCLMSILCV
ncbi:DNA polymerase lambda [Caerostris extrusa]|uniref:DNA polymerase lambda n=1 Tax=Caerostris extrusa TaxID=172846 RepID=A0AAV4XRP4_CAEEX|nr:DNA polymerase lambda [Caerostris extrusa]